MNIYPKLLPVKKKYIMDFDKLGWTFAVQNLTQESPNLTLLFWGNFPEEDSSEEELDDDYEDEE